MKKRSILILMLVAAMAMLAFAGCGNSETSDTASDEAVSNDDGVFVIGLDDSFPPMGFRDEQNEIVGFDVDLAKEVAERMGMTFYAQPIDWDSKEQELNGDHIDCIWSGLTMTDERKESMTFSEPYLENNQIIVVKNDSDIKSLADLAGKKVGMQKGSSAYEAFNASAIKDDVDETVEFADNVSAFQDLNVGRIDAVIVDSIVARYYIQSQDAEFTVLDDSLSPEFYGVGFKKDNTELRDKVQAALDSMVEDGTTAKISEKWFGEDIYYKGE